MVAPVRSQPAYNTSTPAGRLTTVRTVGTQSGVLKKLMTQGNNGLSAAQVTMLTKQVLQAAGVPVPLGVELGLDTAQAIFAGGAVASDLSIGASTLQCVGDVGVGVAAVADALNALGLIDNTEKDVIVFGVSLALAISSGGTNVLADLSAVLSAISLVNDLSPDMFGSQQAADAATRQAVARGYNGILVPQMQAAAQLLKQYTNGQLNLFDFIGGVALQSPTQFATFFPELMTFFPSYGLLTVSATATSSGWFSSKTSSASKVLAELLATKQQVEDILVEHYLTRPMEYFKGFKTIAPVISIEALSVLSLIMQSSATSDVVISFDYNIIGALRGLGVTPSILGDDWLFKGLQRGETDISDWADHLPYPPKTLPYVAPPTASQTINGVLTLTASEAVLMKEAQELIEFQKRMQSLDALGDIESLLALPEAVAILESWAKIHIQPEFYTNADFSVDFANYLWHINTLQQDANVTNDANQKIAFQKAIADAWDPRTQDPLLNMKCVGTSLRQSNWMNEASNVQFQETLASKAIQASIGPQPPGTLYSNNSYHSMDESCDPSTPLGQEFWSFVRKNYVLDMSDYWRILGTLATMKKANLFQDDTTVQDTTDDLDIIQERFQTAYQFVIAKQLNLRARQFLASNLGIPPSLIASRHDSKGNVIFYQRRPA